MRAAIPTRTPMNGLMSPVFAIVALWVLAGSPSRAAEPVTLENDKLRLVFGAQGRLMELGDAAGRVRAPMDRAAHSPSPG